MKIIKRTYGTKDLEELCQRAFEPYFQEEVTVETILNNQKEEDKEEC